MRTFFDTNVLVYLLDAAERSQRTTAQEVFEREADAERVLAGIARSRRARISLWDALIVEAALACGADRILTEDLQHGQQGDGVRIENPFL